MIVRFSNKKMLGEEGNIVRTTLGRICIKIAADYIKASRKNCLIFCLASLTTTLVCVQRKHLYKNKMYKFENHVTFDSNDRLDKTLIDKHSTAFLSVGDAISEQCAPGHAN